MTGLERSSFDNKTVSFEEHCNQEHNMWHYLYFIVLLKLKDPTDFSGPDSYVHELIKVRLSGFAISVLRWILKNSAIFK